MNVPELIEEIMYKPKVPYHDVPKYLKPPICAKELVEFYKRVKRIPDHKKFMVPFTIYEVEFPVPPDKIEHLASYIGDI